MNFIDISQLQKQVIDIAREATQINGTCHLLISGGSSIVPLLSGIKGYLPAKNTKIYIADERVVSLNSDESNQKLIQNLLGKEYEVISYYEGDQPSLEKGKKIFSGVPSIDFAILGSGGDGHICSLFPNNSNLETTEYFISISDSPKPPKERLSVTMNFLKRCKNGAILILGEAKKHLITEFDERLPYGIAIREYGFSCCTDLEHRVKK